jgi:hypothetical protein
MDPKLAEYRRRKAAAQKAADTRRINDAKRRAEFIRRLEERNGKWHGLDNK